MRNAIGIDIGGTNTRAARILADGRIAAHRAGPTERAAGGVLANIAGMVAALRDDETSAIGVGVPGRVDYPSGRILSGGYVDLSVLPLAQRLREICGLETIADNDANAALLAEARLGAARGVRHAVMLTIGTGIGGAVLADGRIFHGGGNAGQLGHVTVKLDGAPCNCGRRGCLETESSGTAFERHLAAAGFAAGTGVADVLNADGAGARAAVAAWATPLRAGLDSLAAVFGCELFILGGGLGAAAVEALARFPAESPWFRYGVTAAALGDAAGVIGAGLAAMEQAP